MSELLADENIPYKAVQAARQIGLEILSVVELATGADDERVIEMARDQGRILVTLEEEIGQYAARSDQDCPGVIQFRVWPKGPRWFADRMRRLLDSSRSLEGMHTVVLEEQVRQFPLPGWQHEADETEPADEQTEPTDDKPDTDEQAEPTGDESDTDEQVEPTGNESDTDEQAEPTGDESDTGEQAEPTGDESDTDEQVEEDQPSEQRDTDEARPDEEEQPRDEANPPD